MKSTIMEDERHAGEQQKGGVMNIMVDVLECTDKYVFVMDMPGCKSDEINICFESDKVLFISAERRNVMSEVLGAKYLHRQRTATKLVKRLAIPSDCNTDAVDAACNDGVLTLTIYKIPPKVVRVNGIRG